MNGRSIAILTVMNGAGAVVAILTSAVTAYLFGTSRALEVYFAAGTLLSLVARLTQVGQLSEIFLPGYHRMRHEYGLEAAQRSFAVVVNWTLLGAGAVCVLLWLAAPYMVLLVVPGFSNADRVLGTTMFRWLLPLLFYEILTSLLQTLSNAERWFGRPEAANVVGSVASLAGLLVFVKAAGIWAMVISLWIGWTIQVLGYFLIARHMGYRHRLILRQKGFSVRTLFSQLLFTLGYVGATQVYAFALNAGLSLLPQGMYAVFNYVQQLYSKTQSVFLRPVSVVFFTRVSVALSKEAENARELAREALSHSLMVWSLLVAVIVVAGRSALAALWGVNKFGADNLTIAVRLLIVFYVLMFVSNIGIISRKTAISLGAVRNVYLYASGMQLLSAGIVYILLPRFGIAGAAGVVAFNVCVLALAPTIALWRERPALVTAYPAAMLWRWLIAMALAVATGGAIVWQADVTGLSTSRVQSLLWAIALAVLVATVAASAAWILNVPEVRAGSRLLGRQPSVR